ncbi:PA14 domain-containing protein [Heterostelium album PN500]|uniref:PA14 domain-containing protein n=1 Tax=Heterostelium pallidum (strain ATCC 26659 / Pp 5 / PN500) TaxID=670386 RepID=D3BU43_HETP5|nr:PA14 domain-containing protein [Heterostelium album PN500]EFA75229.1 PA14 domain-containing protein [Heterostelium album PN500]|eukprot:XP_020427363.1 PA14 domain-containing protein [Heterostelium album PN500]
MGLKEYTWNIWVCGFVFKITITYLMVISISCNIVISQNNAQPSTFTITSRIFDQLPRLNPNFETPEYGQLTPGLINNILDPIKRVPQLNYANPNWQNTFAHGMIKNATLFNTFFINTPGINKPLTFNITLTLNPSAGTYGYDNQTFFPINRLGWDSTPSNYLDSNGQPLYKDTNGNYENFHFCLVSNMFFTYQGYEVFNFRGDDDVWVFINNELVVDLGGLHPAAQASVNLQTDLKTKLVVKQTYTLDFFYCERHTDTSTMKMDTNIQIFCPAYDYCGVCGGDGTSCCNCDDGNPCTDDSCPKPAPGITKDNYKDFCNNIPRTCASDTCNNYVCSKANNGQCVQSGSACPNQDCKVTSCTQKNGCQYTDLCVAQDKCHSTQCVNGTSCTPQTAIQCDQGNKCMNYGCDPNTGCTSSPKNCANPSDTNPCNQYYCEAGTGLCKFITLSDSDCACCKDAKPNLCQVAKCDSSSGKCNVSNITVDDNNPCTTDSCDPATGQITNKPIPCAGCQNCQGGTCVGNDTLCSDGNMCSIDKCALNNTCSFTPVNCDDNDPCTEDTCDPVHGCQHNKKVCPDVGDCQVGVCVAGVGCSTVERNCSTGLFCTDSLCIQGIGCANFTRNCVSDNPKCQKGTCNIEKQECEFVDYSPKPFGCNKAAVISTGVIAGVVVAGAVALAIAVFGGKKGYDAWKNSRNNAVTNLNNNPLYTANPNGGANPLYE